MPVPALLPLADNVSMPPGMPSGGRKALFFGLATFCSRPWLNEYAFS